ncbi:hypothetical protein [Bartonella sp. DGB2]|uniref:hypothetical protein n=1 Tax=Bartonella sp. DGB2 TaxID=3388426 RepID=UPI00398F9F85
MYYAVVKDGVVVNTIVAPENYTYPFDDGAIAIPSNEAGIGWRYENGQFIPPEETEKVVLDVPPDIRLSTPIKKAET